ncbi:MULTISPECIES: hypothetical protein [Rosenbergiella]|uniref:hypothetical protein n=1 Tax=Rosenbergiella TaxID=1356488 RepID=UPI001F500B6A|nr:MULTISPECIES: hypothetical protein [Rosenbergiella]
MTKAKLVFALVALLVLATLGLSSRLIGLFADLTLMGILLCIIVYVLKPRNSTHKK